MASTWGTSWGTSWLDTWARGAVAPPAVTQSNAGGWGQVHARYRDEKEVRQERIARGIIPPDEPAIEALVEASKQPGLGLARRRLRELVEGHIRLAELERLLADVIQTQQIADELAYQEMLNELRRSQAQLMNLNNQTAVLIMLGLL